VFDGRQVDGRRPSSDDGGCHAIHRPRRAGHDILAAGVLFRDSQVRLTDSSDGTSNTLMAGERPPSGDNRPRLTGPVATGPGRPYLTPRAVERARRAGAVTPTGEITVRVRYAETDRMGLLHHANYLVYFEQARTELLRARGITYRDLEDQGFLLVLTRAEVRYKSPARYDDLLRIVTTVTRTTPVRIEHEYKVYRDQTLVAEAATTLACVDRTGRIQAMPEWLMRGTAPPQKTDQ
jgi:acyl-CoA thioester hydrolase